MSESGEGTESNTASAPHELALTESRFAHVGGLTVRRALPTRGRRTVGAWCFVDHMGPESITPGRSFDVAPHPHIGLQTVTWLFSGAFLHRDSLGSEQLIRAGELNLMTSGHGVAHSEENPGLTSGEVHGMQLWVALPASSREGAAAFEHLTGLPQLDLANASATVLVGSFAALESKARHDTEHVGVELDLRGGVTTFDLVPSYEYAIIVASGEVRLDGQVITPGQLGYLGTGRDECALESRGPARAMLIGGEPFEERPFMWWNFVARTQDEITDAWRAWMSGDDRFASVASPFDRIEVAPPPWVTSSR
ncbi:MAG TPA: pirin family protein [Acidimicrobiales bacterium]